MWIMKQVACWTQNMSQFTSSTPVLTQVVPPKLFIKPFVYKESSLLCAIIPYSQVGTKGSYKRQFFAPCQEYLHVTVGRKSRRQNKTCEHPSSAGGLVQAVRHPGISKQRHKHEANYCSWKLFKSEKRHCLRGKPGRKKGQTQRWYGMWEVTWGSELSACPVWGCWPLCAIEGLFVVSGHSGQTAAIPCWILQRFCSNHASSGEGSFFLSLGDLANWHW